MQGAISGLLVLVLIVTHLLLPVWAFLDARENSSARAGFWALVVLFAPLLGILSYLALGRNRTGEDPLTVADLPHQFREGSDPKASSSPMEKVRDRKRMSSEQDTGFIPVGVDDDE